MLPLPVLAGSFVDVDGVLRTGDAGTGVAVILVEDSGQNRILLAAGANGALQAADIDRMSAVIANAAMLIVQFEVPMAVVERAVDIAHAAGVPVLLNPAPAKVLPEGLLARVAILVPNETEAALLAGLPVQDPAEARDMLTRGHIRSKDDFETWVRWFCQGKYMSDFAKEMNRSVEGYLGAFRAPDTVEPRDKP